APRPRAGLAADHERRPAETCCQEQPGRLSRTCRRTHAAAPSCRRVRPGERAALALLSCRAVGLMLLAAVVIEPEEGARVDGHHLAQLARPPAEIRELLGKYPQALRLRRSPPREGVGGQYHMVRPDCADGL